MELKEQIRRPISYFPDHTYPLPAEFLLEQQRGKCDDGPFQQPNSASTFKGCDDDFTQQALAIRFFDQTLEVLRQPTTKETKLSELNTIDRRLQDFLRVSMEQHASKSGNRPSPVMPTIFRYSFRYKFKVALHSDSKDRSFFVLHEEILALLVQPSSAEAQTQRIQACRTTISTYVKMVVDVAQHFMTLAHDSPAPCCIYCIRTALKHAQTLYLTPPETVQFSDITILQALEKSLTYRV